jgi:outer membrane murein-binding lipoprotein Lpp
MTSTIGIKVDKKSHDFVNQRSHIWKKYDEARQQETELNQYTGQFGGSGSSQSLPTLSNSKTPPDELAAAVWQLKQKVEKINQAKSQVQEYQDEIAKTNQQFLIVAGIAVAIVLILLIMIFNH